MPRAQVLCAALLGAFLIQGAMLIARTSPTTDEVAFHMVNGYTYLKTHNYRMSPANPALVRQWMALPWLFMNPRLDLDKDSWREADSVPFGVEFFYRDNRDLADKLLYASRAMILLLGALLGWLIYDWSRRLYGPEAGLLSLAFYSFCPSLIAHSAIAHTDVAVSLFVFWSGYALWKYLLSGRSRDRLLFCVLFGLAAACKYHALFFGPFYLIVLGMKKGLRTAFKTALLLGIITLAVIWASYLFDLKPLLFDGVPRVEEKLRMLPAALRDAATALPLPAPSYWMGLAGIFRGHQSSYLHYAFGEWTTDPQPLFYIFSFLVKMTFPLLAALVIRAFFWKRPGAHHGESLILVGAPIAWFAALTHDSTGVGVRYVFPVLPFLFVWIGALAVVLPKKKWRFWLLAGLLLWNTVSTVLSFPNYLSYFNEVVGGVAGGHRYVRGSDVDWGQGLKELKRYMDKNGLARVTLHYFGTADPSFYGIPFERATEQELARPLGKVYAVSLFLLEHALWAKERKPDAIVGGSIALYDLRK